MSWRMPFLYSAGRGRTFLIEGGSINSNQNEQARLAAFSDGGQY